MEEQFPVVVGNSHYEKLWNHLDKRELRDFGSTNGFTNKDLLFSRIKVHVKVFLSYLITIKENASKKKNWKLRKCN